jgi:predicted protein tyrosine phosphatase
LGSAPTAAATAATADTTPLHEDNEWASRSVVMQRQTQQQLLLAAVVVVEQGRLAQLRQRQLGACICVSVKQQPRSSHLLQ